MNKQIFMLFGFLLLLLSCKQATTPQGTDEANKVNSDIIETTTTQPDISAIEQFVGKYPEEIKLFQNFRLEPILRKMMGDSYNQMITDWNVETPIEADDRIFYTTGCKKSACNDQFYLLILDARDNNINLFHFNKGIARSYEYSGIIGMSEKLAKLFEQIRMNTNQ